MAISAAKVRDARAAAGMSQAALARESGVSRQTINKIEQGKATNPIGSVVAALARAMKVKPTDLEA